MLISQSRHNRPLSGLQQLNNERIELKNVLIERKQKLRLPQKKIEKLRSKQQECERSH